MSNSVTSLNLDDFLTGPKHTRDALKKHLEKQIAEPKARRKNKKPEKEAQKKIFSWAKGNCFEVYITDVGLWARLGMIYDCPFPLGHSDITGNDYHGIAVYIECKALGRLSTLSQNQFEFLTQKINSNCFAVCVDSPELLEEYYSKFIQLRRVNRDKAKAYLASLLPKKFLEQHYSPLF